MRFVIIEDELPAYESLASHLRTIESGAIIYPQIHSVEEAILFFNQHLPYDLVFADIHLQDGRSLDVLSAYPISAPIVFTTAHDSYLQDAFGYKSIDYLLKPVDIIKLKKTLEKYQQFQTFFHPRDKQPGQTRERIIVKRGNDFQLLTLADIQYLFTENKLVFAVDKEKKKYLCSEANLSDLMDHLDPSSFFRANRKYIINMKFLEKFHPDERSRVVIKMQLPPDEPILISQENAAAFRKWVGQE